MPSLRRYLPLLLMGLVLLVTAVALFVRSRPNPGTIAAGDKPTPQASPVSAATSASTDPPAAPTAATTLPAAPPTTGPEAATSAPLGAEPSPTTDSGEQLEADGVITDILGIPILAPRRSELAEDPNRVVVPVVVPLQSGGVVDEATARGMVFGALMAYEKYAPLLFTQTVTVELQFFLDRAVVPQASQVAEGIVLDPNAMCVVGHYTSPTTNVGAQVYRQEGLASITPSSTDAEVTNTGWHNLRLAGTDIGRGIASAKYASDERGGTTAFVIYEETRSNYETAALNFIEAGRSQYGLEITVPERGGYDIELPGTLQLILDQLQAQIASNTPPDVIYLAANPDESVTIVRAIRTMGFTGDIIGADGMDTQKFADITAVEADLEPLFTLTVALPPDRGRNGERFTTNYLAFVNAKGEPSVDVPPFAAETHDATYLCMKAIADASIGGKPTRSQVLARLQELSLSDDLQNRNSLLNTEILYTGPYFFADGRGDSAGVYYVRTISNGDRTSDASYRCSNPACTTIE